MKRQLFFLLLCMTGLCFTALQAQEVVDKVTFESENANIKMVNPSSYLLEIAGPNGYYFKDNVAKTNNLSISNLKADGEKFGDGLYQIQITPILELTATQREEMNAIRAEADYDKMESYRLANDLPASVSAKSIYFSIRNGEFVRPDQKEYGSLKMPTSAYTWEHDHPAMYASIENVVVEFDAPMVGHSNNVESDKTMLSEDDQVFLDDVIVSGSICVGQDCVNGENFGFDTERLKENNLRLHFDDTSSSASFPSNDWRITINDSANGGASYFAVEDATAGNVPFRIEAGAGANALYVDNSGNVGIGTSTPVVELQVTDGDTPTLRLEQNGSSGFGSQIWDVAGNETNFFVRDVNNGSLLPFRIKPSAPTNSLFVAANGDIGLGTENPNAALQVESGNAYIKSGNLGINVDPTVALDVVGISKFTGASVMSGNVSYFLPTSATYLSSGFMPIMKVDATNRFVGIRNNNPGVELDVCGTIAATNTTVAMSTTCSSDIRFKKNVQTLSRSLDKLTQLRGVNYNWKVSEFPEKGFNDSNQIGFIAQEMETLFPELVTTDAKGYKAVDYAKLSPVLVEAVKEQQTIINAQQQEIASLQNEIQDLKTLKAQVAELTGMISSLKKADSASEKAESIGKKK